MADFNQSSWSHDSHVFGMDQGTGGLYNVLVMPSMHPSVSGNVLLFQIVYRFTLPPDVDPPNIASHCRSSWDLCVPGFRLSLLVDDIGSWLSSAGVLFGARNDILQTIFGSTWTSETILAIFVEIETLSVQPDIDEYDEAEFVRVTQKPASLEVVEALEKVVVSDAEREMSCAVCLEEFALGSELTKMPCSHAFHGDCIVKWLEYQCVCPFCRFKLPSTVMLG